jgi:glucan biosynthesis protein C
LRRRDLDVTRELIVASLILFHTASIFSEFNFYVKNETQEPAITLFIVLTSLWGIPLLFMIAGFAIWHSLNKRTWLDFLQERLLRLLIPFIVGVVVIVPPQLYYQLRSDPAYQESYLQFLPRFFDVTFSLDFPWFFSASPKSNVFQPAHLWFLYILLVFTLLLLPVFLYLRQPPGQQLIGRAASVITSPWRLIAAALPIAVIEAALGTDMAGGWNQNAYIIFLLYGYLLAADARFRKAIRRYWKISFVLAIAGSLGGITGFVLIAKHTHEDPLKGYELSVVILRLFKGLVGWFWMIAILGLIEHVRQNRKLANILSKTNINTCNRAFPDRVERYANEAVLPFYILHQTVIVVVAFYVVQWNAGALLKFLVISMTTLIITLFLYEVAIKRTMATRFLFGMKSRTVYR